MFSLWQNQESLCMNLRLATIDDAEFLRRIRNDPETRRWSRTEGEISKKAHDDWFRTTTDRIFIAETDGVAVGAVRLVRHPHELELGLVVAPEHRGKGYAVKLIELGKAEAWAPVVAYVRSDNTRSVRAFNRAGFKLDDTYVRFTSQ